MEGAAEWLIPLIAILEIDLRVLSLPQVGHDWPSLDPDIRNFFSKGCSHSRQTKVYIGINDIFLLFGLIPFY